MEFDWDDGNRDKNLSHGVHDWEIEEAFGDQDRLVVERVHSDGEERFILLGRALTSGKYLRIVFTVRMYGTDRLLRPISAVEMTQQNRRRYRRNQ